MEVYMYMYMYLEDLKLVHVPSKVLILSSCLLKECSSFSEAIIIFRLFILNT